ncbi:uncharacterized protein LOC144656311 [Oculina patagonica]
MNVSICSTFLLLLVATFISDRQVTGKCGESIADTPWAACLVAEEGGGCPHNFKKLDVDHTTCYSRGYRRPPFKPRVCCLLTPVFEVKVQNAPCLGSGASSDDVEKKSHKDD